VASNRPIFIFGCPRSGTTLLSLMLHAHSRIAMPPETRFLMPVYRRRATFGDLTDIENRRALARYILWTRGNKFRHLGLPRPRVRRQIVAGPPTIGSAVGAVHRSYAARFGKERWGDKLPTYFRNVDAIRALFPDAQFIHLIRDGRDCVASLKRMSWWKQSSIDAMALWTHSIDCGSRAARRLPADSFYSLRYEQLVTDPRGELMALCAFLGEEFEEAMLESHLAAAQALPERQRTAWHVNTGKAVSAAAVGSYAEGLDAWELRLMEFVAGGRLRRLGYDVLERQAAPPVGALLRYLQKLTWLRLRTRVLILRDRRIARMPGPIADQEHS
jgi:hypothetical protein